MSSSDKIHLWRHWNPQVPYVSRNWPLPQTSVKFRKESLNTNCRTLSFKSPERTTFCPCWWGVTDNLTGSQHNYLTLFSASLLDPSALLWLQALGRFPQWRHSYTTFLCALNSEIIRHTHLPLYFLPAQFKSTVSCCSFDWEPVPTKEAGRLLPIYMQKGWVLSNFPESSLLTNDLYFCFFMYKIND